jgi:hypothetical protein
MPQGPKHLPLSLLCDLLCCVFCLLLLALAQELLLAIA